MFCDSCGTELREDQRFCPACGKAVAGVTRKGISTHVRLLGILWLAYSAVRLIPGIAILGMLQTNLDFLPPDVPSFVPHLIRFVGLLSVAAAVVGGVIGWGLLTWQPWARLAAIVFGCISLIEVPFGTALGIYTLWALLPQRSGQEYRARALAQVSV
jgi:zinc-ribbon domain